MLKPRSNEVPSVWVEGSTLRRFFSCTDSMEDLLNKDEPILRHKRLLCKHGKGLHPRVARCGKMLTKDQFQAYLDLLKLEREENIQDHDTGMFTMELKTNVCDLMITNTTCLHCDECASEYKSELADKYKSYCCLLSLENTLAPENDPDLNEDERLFAVSRSFVTNLRKFAASKILKYSIATKSCLASNCVDAPVVGVDHYDISEFLAKFSNEDTSTEKDGMDPCVNSKIVCKYASMLCSFQIFKGATLIDTRMFLQANMDTAKRLPTNKALDTLQRTHGATSTSCFLKLYPFLSNTWME